MKQLYINGKEASLWQKILFGMAMIGFLCLLIPLGITILLIGLVFVTVFYVYIYFKVKKIKKMMQMQEENIYQQPNQTVNNTREDVIDGEYKEL